MKPVISEEVGMVGEQKGTNLSTAITIEFIYLLSSMYSINNYQLSLHAPAFLMM